MNKLILILLLFTCTFFLPRAGKAQVNLVRNPSFEQRDTCPWNSDQLSIAKYWSSPDTDYIPPYPYVGSPNCAAEYANTCSTDPEIEVPLSTYYYQYPRTGNGMALGIMYFDEGYTTDYKRDYMMGRLYHPLVSGKSYCVTFFANRTESAGYAVNHIGAYFDDGSIDTFSQCGYPHSECVPQVASATVIVDTQNWTKIQGSFIANGTERYLTIGNFYDTAHTTVIGTGAAYSYYLIDDVSVIASDATAYAGPDVAIAPGDSTYIGVDSNGEGMPCYWYVLGGISPIDSGGRILVKPGSTTSYVVMMDLCGVVTYDTVVVHVGPLTVPVLFQRQNVLRVYPNPVSDELYIDDAQQNTSYRIMNVTGSCIQRGILQQGANLHSVKDFVPGIYILELTGTNGARNMVRVVKE